MRAGVATMFLAVMLLGGCERSAAPAAPAPPTATGTRGPRQTLLELRELRRTRHYDRMKTLIVAPRAPGVIQTLLAIDDFLAANERLCNWVRDQVGIGLAQSIDQSYLGDDLGFYLCNSMNVFASDVELLDESAHGEDAVVSFIVSGRSPAEEAQLHRSAGAWCYDPGRAVPAGFAAAFRDMTAGLRELVAELETGQISVADVRDERELLMDKVQAKLRRGVRLLSEARAESAGATTTPARQ
jgi:hypothetical protein